MPGRRVQGAPGGAAEPRWLLWTELAGCCGSASRFPRRGGPGCAVWGWQCPGAPSRGDTAWCLRHRDRWRLQVFLTSPSIFPRPLGVAFSSFCQQREYPEMCHMLSSPLLSSSLQSTQLSGRAGSGAGAQHPRVNSWTAALRPGPRQPVLGGLPTRTGRQLVL